MYANDTDPHRLPLIALEPIGGEEVLLADFKGPGMPRESIFWAATKARDNGCQSPQRDDPFKHSLIEEGIHCKKDTVPTSGRNLKRPLGLAKCPLEGLSPGG
jgi:hypothetical protein